MKRPLAIIGFSYFITFIFLSFLPENFLPIISGVFSALFLLSIIIKESRKSKVLVLSFLTCLIATIVYCINFNVNIKPIHQYDKSESEISGIIYDTPYKKYNIYNYTLKISNINGKEVKPFKLILQSYSTIECDICDKITANAYIYLPENNSTFDSEKHYRSKNIFAKAFLRDYMPITVQKTEKAPWIYYILKLRKQMLSIPYRIFPLEIATIVNGIFLGEKNALSQDIKTNFDKIGIYHILATSGIHIAILSQFFIKIFKKIKLGNKSSLILSAFAVLIFMAVSGFTPSTTKAGIMCIIFLLGKALSRNSDSITSLGTAVFIICLINPNSGGNTGLILSFVSTLGIILSYQHIKNFLYEKSKFLTKKSKIINYIISGMSISLSVYFFTLPLILWIYGKTSILFILSNIIIIPLATLIFNLSLIINILTLIKFPSFLIDLTALPCGIIAKLIIKISCLLSKIPFSLISLDYAITYVWIICVLILIAVYLQLYNSKKILNFTILIILNLGLAAILSYQIINHDVLHANIIPCHDGISLIFSQNMHKSAILYLNENTSTQNIENQLSKSHINNLDYLNLSISNNSQKAKTQNIIKSYHPQTVILSNPNKINLNLQSDDTHITYFQDNSKSYLWQDLIIETKNIKNHTYIRVESKQTSFLILPTGGNTIDLPEEWKTGDFLILGGVPMKLCELSYKHIFLSMNKKDSEINLSKLSSKGKTAFSLSNQGEIYINIKSNKNYQIRRLR